MKALITRIPYAIWCGICNAKIGRGSIDYTNAMQGRALVRIWIRGYNKSGATVNSGEIKAKVWKLDAKDNPYDPDTKTIRIGILEHYGCLENLYNDDNTYDGLLLEDVDGEWRVTTMSTKFNMFAWMSATELNAAKEQLDEVLATKGIVTKVKNDVVAEVKNDVVAKVKNNVVAEVKNEVVGKVRGVEVDDELRNLMYSDLTTEERLKAFRECMAKRGVELKTQTKEEQWAEVKAVKSLKEAVLEEDDDDDDFAAETKAAAKECSAVVEEECPFDADDCIRHENMSNFTVDETEEIVDEKEHVDSAKLEEMHKKLEDLKERMHKRDELMKLVDDDDEIVMLKRMNAKDKKAYWELSEEYSRLSK